MKHRYTAKVYFEDGLIKESKGDNIEKLIKWMSDRADASFSDIKGEIFDNHAHHIVRSIQYSPPNK